MPGNATKTDKSLIKDREEKAVRDNVADRLSDLIAERRITADTLAKVTGIAKGTISNYLNAKTSPKAFELKKLADFFEVPTDYLIYKNGPKSLDIDIRAIHEITGLSDDAIESIRNIYAMSSKKHDHFVGATSEKSGIDVVNALLSYDFISLINRLVDYKRHCIMSAAYKRLQQSLVKAIEAGPLDEDMFYFQASSDRSNRYTGYGIALDYHEYKAFIKKEIKEKSLESIFVATENTITETEINMASRLILSRSDKRKALEISAEIIGRQRKQRKSIVKHDFDDSEREE